ncbi:MAG: DUF1517 domain-containing protein [candidate division NC10 bacterium]|nr:DUF1517 domain-containing protein [candidate division NC10 bacterium]
MRTQGCRRWIAGVVILLLFGFAGQAGAKQAGGRFGGSPGFKRSQRSFGGFPTRPGSPGRYSEDPFRPYRGVPVPSPGFFVAPLPFGGGAFATTDMILVLVIGGFIFFILINDIWTRLSGGRWWGYGQSTRGRGTYTIAKLQLGLFATARFIQDELKQLAKKGMIDSPEGVSTLLTETAVALGRAPEYWKYALWQVQRAEDQDQAQALFQEVVTQERMKLSREVTFGVEEAQDRGKIEGEERPVGGYLMVTVIVAVTLPVFDTIAHPTEADITRILTKMGGLPPGQLLGMEVIWTPEAQDEALTEEELIAEYPELEPL